MFRYSQGFENIRTRQDLDLRGDFGTANALTQYPGKWGGNALGRLYTSSPEVLMSNVGTLRSAGPAGLSFVYRAPQVPARAASSLMDVAEHNGTWVGVLNQTPTTVSVASSSM